MEREVLGAICPHCHEGKPELVKDGEKKYYIECPICEVRGVSASLDRAFRIFFKILHGAEKTRNDGAYISETERLVQNRTKYYYLLDKEYSADELFELDRDLLNCTSEPEDEEFLKVKNPDGQLSGTFEVVIKYIPGRTDRIKD